jgi:hypothetical protein
MQWKFYLEKTTSKIKHFKKYGLYKNSSLKRLSPTPSLFHAKKVKTGRNTLRCPSICRDFFQVFANTTHTNGIANFSGVLLKIWENG